MAPAIPGSHDDRENLHLFDRCTESLARDLVERGHYADLSAVLQHGLELLRARREEEEADIAGLRMLIEVRQRGRFISMKEGRKRIEQMIAAAPEEAEVKYALQRANDTSE